MGRPTVDHFLTKSTAVAIGAITSTPLGNAILARLVDHWRKKGRSSVWIAKRLEWMAIRSMFTDVLKEHGVTGNGYMYITDGMCLELFNRLARQFRKERGLTLASRDPPWLDVIEELEPPR
jgi:hypothetical protein